MRIFKLIYLAAFLVLPACLLMNGSYGDYHIAKRAPATQVETTQTAATAPASGVYINNVRLSDQEAVLLASILKEEHIPAGRYYVTNGMMGLEGQLPYGNIIPYIQEYQQRHARSGGNRTGRSGGDVVINSRGGVGNGTLVGNGTCMMASVPGVSLSSGC